MSKLGRRVSERRSFFVESEEPNIHMDDDMVDASGRPAAAGTETARVVPYYLLWRTQGDADVCEKCADRHGKQYSFETLPNWPGDGAFGQCCDLGLGCRCELDFIENGMVVQTYTWSPVRTEAARQELADIVVQRNEYFTAWRSARESLYTQMTAQAEKRKVDALARAHALHTEAQAAEVAGKLTKARDLRARAGKWIERSGHSHDAVLRAKRHDAVRAAMAAEQDVLPQDITATELAARLAEAGDL